MPAAAAALRAMRRLAASRSRPRSLALLARPRRAAGAAGQRPVVTSLTLFAGTARGPVALDGLGRTWHRVVGRTSGVQPRRPRGRARARAPRHPGLGGRRRRPLPLGGLRRDLGAGVAHDGHPRACCPRASRSRRPDGVRRDRRRPPALARTRARPSRPPRSRGRRRAPRSSGRGRRWSWPATAGVLVTRDEGEQLRGPGAGPAAPGRCGRWRCRRTSPWTRCCSRRPRRAASTAPPTAGARGGRRASRARRRRPRVARAVPLRGGRAAAFYRSQDAARAGRGSSASPGRPSRLMFPLAPAAGLEAFLATDQGLFRTHGRRRALGAGGLRRPGRPDRRHVPAARPIPGKKRQAMRFTKAHGLGNDFILVGRRRTRPREASPRWARAALRPPPRASAATASCCTRARRTASRSGSSTPTGCEGEISGNGLRCLAALAVARAAGRPPRHVVHTVVGPKAGRGERRRTEPLPHRHRPGAARRSAAATCRWPSTRRSATVIDHPLEAAGRDGARSPRRPWATRTAPCSSTQPADDALLAALGPALERHPFFPKRTNVEFITVVSPSEIRVRFWERGVGYTMASGTGSASAAVASIITGRTGRSVRAVCDGGTLDDRVARGRQRPPDRRGRDPVRRRLAGRSQNEHRSSSIRGLASVATNTGHPASRGLASRIRLRLYPAFLFWGDFAPQTPRGGLVRSAPRTPRASGSGLAVRVS